MRVEQWTWTSHSNWTNRQGEPLRPDLVLAFGARAALSDPARLAELAERWPMAPIVGCSTAGEISGNEVSDGGIVATGVKFDATTCRVASAELRGPEESFDAGRRLREALAGDGLRHILVFSEGVHVNGSDLSRGLAADGTDDVAVTGGLAGDGAAFTETCVVVNGVARANVAVAVGLYGTNLRVGFGTLGGWDTFGPDRRITRSSDNVLFELDGESALALYRRYLGDHARDLPASGLLFPLALLGPDRRPRLVRTILGVDEAAGSLIFAGDVPQGSSARLMRANLDRLIDGASGAAASSRDALREMPAQLAILVSCVGRKLVLGVRTVEEVEGVRDVLGPGCVFTGFYSYGEISPLTPQASCDLHNQTMTITTLSEV